MREGLTILRVSESSVTINKLLLFFILTGYRNNSQLKKAYILSIFFEFRSIKRKIKFPTILFIINRVFK